MFIRRDDTLVYVDGQGKQFSLASVGEGLVGDGYEAIIAACRDGDHSGLAVLRHLAPNEYTALRDATRDAASAGDIEALDILLDDTHRMWNEALVAALRNGEYGAAMNVWDAMVRIGYGAAADLALEHLGEFVAGMFRNDLARRRAG